MSFDDKVCGPKSSKHVKAYTRNELLNLIVNSGKVTIKEAKNMNMKQLCESLGIQYTDPSGYAKNIIFDDYENCVQTKKEDILIQHQKEIEEKGIDIATARTMNKEILCDFIYKESDPIKIPEDFTNKDCSKYIYNVVELRRIAINLKLDVSRARTAKDLCDLLSKYYAQKKMKFDTSISSDWKEYPNQEHPCIIPLTTEGNLSLQEHQKLVVKHLLNHRSLLAVHSTGSGKTLTAVAAMHCVLTKFPNIKVVVVTPLSLVDNFKENILRFGIDIDDPLFTNKVEIRSYDEYINQQKRKKEVECNNTFLIIDEAHNFRTSVTIQKEGIKKGSGAFIMMKCASQAFKVLLLTATPLVNSRIDLYNLYRMVEGIDPSTIIQNKQISEGIDIESEFHKMFKCKVSYYEPPKDNYPERIDIPIEQTTLYMDDDYYKEYKLIEELKAPSAIVDILHLAEKNVFLHNLRKAVNTIDKVRTPKVDWVVDFLKREYEAGRKTIVFSNWKMAGMNLIRERLDKLTEEGYKNMYAYISGNVSPNVRRIIKKRYNQDKIKTLLITRAGGEGLNLKKTRNVIILESNWNPSIDEQVIGRAIRYKSHEDLPPEERNVRVYKLLLKKPTWSTDNKPSVDDMLYKMSQEKKVVIDFYKKWLQNASIERNNCNCYLAANSSLVGCETMYVPGRYINPNELPYIPRKDEGYQAPGEFTNLAIRPEDIGEKVWLKLAGLQKDILTGNLRKIVRKKDIKQIVFEDDILFETDPVPPRRPKKKIVFDEDDDVKEIGLGPDNKKEYPIKSQVKPVVLETTEEDDLLFEVEEKKPERKKIVFESESEESSSESEKESESESEESLSEEEFESESEDIEDIYHPNSSSDESDNEEEEEILNKAYKKLKIESDDEEESESEPDYELKE